MCPPFGGYWTKTDASASVSSTQTDAGASVCPDQWDAGTPYQWDAPATTNKIHELDPQEFEQDPNGFDEQDPPSQSPQPLDIVADASDVEAHEKPQKHVSDEKTILAAGALATAIGDLFPDLEKEAHVWNVVQEIYDLISRQAGASQAAPALAAITTRVDRRMVNANILSKAPEARSVAWVKALAQGLIDDWNSRDSWDGVYGYADLAEPEQWVKFVDNYGPEGNRP
jgi:hypothetical protein